MTARGKTTPASTEGSYSPHTGSRSRVELDTADSAPSVSRSSGVVVGGGFVAGGGYRGATDALDNTVQTAANGMAEWGGDVEIRFNSDRRSGGAWLVTSRNGRLDSNCEVGLNAYDGDNGCMLRINRGALADPTVLPADDTYFEQHYPTPEEAVTAMRALALPADQIRSKIDERDTARARYNAEVTEFLQHPRAKGDWYVRDIQRAEPVTLDTSLTEGTWLIVKADTYRILRSDGTTLDLVSADRQGNPRRTTTSLAKVVEVGSLAITHFPSPAPVLPTETFPR